MKMNHGLDPAAESQGARERAEGFTSGPLRPVLEATQIAEFRLVVTAAHLEGVAALLDLGRPGSSYAISALSRTALESSARAGWLLDTQVGGRTRGLRGMAEAYDDCRAEVERVLWLRVRPDEQAGRDLRVVTEAGACAPSSLRKSSAPFHRDRRWAVLVELSVMERRSRR